MNSREKGWFLYRLPNTTEIIYGEGKVKQGLAERGFAFAPFESPDPSSISTICCSEPTLIPVKNAERLISELLPSLDIDINDELKFTPHTFEEYKKSIEEIQNYLRKNNPKGKVVLSRRIPHKSRIDISNSFISLCSSYPEAFVFCFYTPISGCWIGASPELLLKISDNTVYTMALAGTRNAGVEQSVPWDDKNKEEHNIVVDYILNVLKEYGIKPQKGELQTKKAGPVEHLQTKIEGRVPKDFKITEFLCRFSPTPALCGSTSRKEIPLIKCLEETPRFFYGGWCGPLSQHSLSFFVNLRSAYLECDKNGINAILFSGGGITLKSEAKDEWEETERKASTLLNIIK